MSLPAWRLVPGPWGDLGQEKYWCGAYELDEEVVGTIDLGNTVSLLFCGGGY